MGARNGQRGPQWLPRNARKTGSRSLFSLWLVVSRFSLLVNRRVPIPPIPNAPAVSRRVLLAEWSE